MEAMNYMLCKYIVARRLYIKGCQEMKDYIVYECMRCKQVFAIPLEHLRIPQNKDRHLSCNYGHRQIKELNEYDSIKECMDNHVYKRDKGVIKQIK